MITAGLSLIGKHAAQFKEYLAKDHEVHDYTTCILKLLSDFYMQCSYSCRAVILECMFTCRLSDAVHVQNSSGVESTQQQRHHEIGPACTRGFLVWGKISVPHKIVYMKQITGFQWVIGMMTESGKWKRTIFLCFTGITIYCWECWQGQESKCGNLQGVHPAIQNNHRQPK